MTKKQTPKRDYEVGYGKPPKHTRWGPGESGNWTGRPKGSKGLKARLLAAVEEPVIVVENGQQVKITMLDLMLKGTTRAAAKGNVAAAKQLFTMMRTMGLTADPPSEKFDTSDEVLVAIIEKSMRLLKLRGKSDLFAHLVAPE